MNRFSRLALLAMLALPLPSLAELMLNPTRVVLAGNQRATQIELINNSSEPATYRIGIVNRRMTETGEFVSIDTPGPDELFAGPMLAYSPRQVTLAPGTAQVVRLMVRKPDGLAEGEYRSHLHFEKLAAPGDLASSVEPDGAGQQRIGVVLKTLIGASIPVIVRHGATSARVALTQLALQQAGPGQAPQLAFLIERQGNQSVYGDLAAYLVAPGGGEQLLARASGVAVYTPNSVRKAGLILQLSPGARLDRGRLRLAYHERPDAGGKLIAEASLALP
ncbi:molecular chaperone [Massilia sp. PAMC28688]|uniref:fimbrial biogenesis chaperone n=1 Tax=Massilia sp. PAMC28688 TaxID=2861283 RepID=UPI001C639294|nr:molecular chaperone [Massilia sp. PAMC28688]QYF93427.1 molecular chaperone [Massilia sp. PAMC28688]